MKVTKLAIISFMIINMMLPATTQASEYGCKVLLCLANPASNGGPMGVAECVPPISQLYDDLANARPFPTCDLADGDDGSAYAQLVSDPYDPCPAPLVPAKKGEVVIEGTTQSFYDNGEVKNYTLNGEAQISEAQNNSARACVDNLLGTTRSYIRQLRGVEYSNQVNIYDKIIWQQWQSPNAIDVYIDGQFHNRVHY